MLAIALSQESENHLEQIAMRAGLTRDELARRAILDFLEEQQDAETALERIERPAPRWSQTDLEQGLDLEN